MKNSILLATLALGLTFNSCIEDSPDPLTRSLINTKWELNKVEVYYSDTNEILETIEPESSLSKNLYFRDINTIQLYADIPAGANGCGSWKIASKNLIANIKFHQIIPGICAETNFTSHYRCNNKIDKIDNFLIIQGITGSFDSINSSYKNWADLIGGKLYILSYYIESMQDFPEPSCC